MFEEGREENPLVGILFTIVVLLVVGFFVFNTTQSHSSREIVVSGEITNADYDFKNDELFVNITFNNTKNYNLKIYKDVDLTVNSTIVLKLRQYGSRGWVWEDFNWKEYYVIDRILKIPLT